MSLTTDEIFNLFECAPPQPDVVSSAEYADHKRVCLKRQWGPLSPLCAILMHEPSTANAIDDDTTITRCINICKSNGYGGIMVYNLKYKQEIPYRDIVIAWGNNLSVKETQKTIGELSKHNLLCFTKLKNGNPGLPTRLGYNTKIIAF